MTKLQAMHRLGLALLAWELVSSTRAADLPNAVYTMNVDGSEVRRLARAEGFSDHSAPRWSHDGKRVVFDALPAGGFPRRMFIVNAEGTELRELGHGTMPAWSPDDKQIGYHLWPGAGKAELYVQNVDGQGRTHLGRGHSPRWSPDGTRMATTDGTNLTIVDLVTSDATVLFDQPYFEVFRGFAFTPDGKRMAVSVRGGDGEQRQLLLVSTEGASSGLTLKLKANQGGFVSFSPDGRRLIYSTDNTLYIIEVDGNNPGQLVPGQRGENRNPDWSPDGKKIVFVSDRDFN